MYWKSMVVCNHCLDFVNDYVIQQTLYYILKAVCKNVFSYCVEKNVYTVKPLLCGHHFYTTKVAFQEGWPLVRGRNQYIYV